MRRIASASCSADEPATAAGAVPAATSARTFASSCSSRWAAHSVSVSLTNSTPAASSSARSVAKFSIMPLWMMASRPLRERCGWALRSVGLPWVAHRVWPMPVVPVLMALSGAWAASSCSRLPSLPARFTVMRSRPSSGDAPESLPRTATPAESYPRYSSRRNPSTMMPSAGRAPTYPTIPHMRTI